MKRDRWQAMAMAGLLVTTLGTGCKPTYKIEPAKSSTPPARATAPSTMPTPTPAPTPTSAPAVATKPASLQDPGLPDYIANPTRFEGWTTSRIAETTGRRSEHYMKRVTLFVQQLPTVKPGNTMFLGDSITEGFPLGEAFPKMNVVNHGIGGDNIEGVHERLGLIVAAKPARIIMKIGTNDTSWIKTAETSELAARYGRLLDAIKYELPSTELIVLSILPIGSAAKYDPGRARLDELNVEIKRLCAERGVRFIDIFPAFADDKRHLREEFTVDGVHLTPLGYWQWVLELHKAGLITDQQMAEARGGLGARIQRVYALPRIANKVDPGLAGEYPGNRGANELVIYLPSKMRATTGTNEYGIEATVVGDTVTEISRAGNAPIPADGYVISGHGEAAAWISAYLRVGSQVTRNGASLTPVGAKPPQ